MELSDKEAEVVDEIFVTATEVSTELRILCGNTHRTGIQVTLTHHHTTQDDEGCSTETEFLCTEQSHRVASTTHS